MGTPNWIRRREIEFELYRGGIRNRIFLRAALFCVCDFPVQRDRPVGLVILKLTADPEIQQSGPVVYG